MRAEWGLDQPIIVQYAKWLWHIVQGDWGRSMFSRKPVFDEVLAKLPLTLELVVLALFFELLISVPAGVLSAVKPYTWWDYGASTFALIGVSIPSFFLGILLFLTFGLWLGWLPVQGYVPLSESVSENLRHLLLPTVALGVARTAILTRLIRASMLEVIRQEYVTTARSKGLAERIVISKHALRTRSSRRSRCWACRSGFWWAGRLSSKSCSPCPALAAMASTPSPIGTTRRCWALFWCQRWSFSWPIWASISCTVFLDPRIRYGNTEA